MTDPSISLDVRAPQIEQPAQVLSQYANLRNLMNQGQLQQQQLVGVGQENQMRQEQLDTMKSLNDSYRDALNPDGTVDTGKLIGSLAKSGHGAATPGVMKAQTEYQKSMADLAKTNGEVATQQADAAGMLGLAARKANYLPQYYLMNLQGAIQAKAVSPQLIQPHIQAIQQAMLADAQNGTNTATDLVKQYAENSINASPKAMASVAAENNSQGRLLAGQTGATRETAELPGQQAQAEQQVRANLATKLLSVPAGPERDTMLGEIPLKTAQLFVGKTDDQIRRLGQTPEQQTQADNSKLYQGAELALRKQQIDIEASRLRQEATNKETMTLTPAAKDQMATYFATTGQLPSLGMGAAAAQTRSDIINRAAEMFPNVAFASNAAQYQANKASLKNVTGTLDTLSAFENSGLKNLKMFTDAAAKIPDTGVPWLNTPVRLLTDKLVGNENMAVVNAARTIGLREIARVTNDPKLSGVLSDSARQEVQAFSPANATFPQILAVAKTLQQDMANVHSSLQTQKDAIGQRIGVNPDASTSGGALPKGNGGVLTDAAIVTQFLQAAGGDKNKARELARQNGWKF